jgi:hypothetical protein
VAGEVEPLQAFVDGVAQVVLHVEGDAATDEAAHVGGDEADQADQNQDAQPGGQRPAGADDDVVDDQALDGRSQRGHALAQHGHAEGERHLAAMHGEEGQEATDPAPARGGRAHPPDGRGVGDLGAHRPRPPFRP